MDAGTGAGEPVLQMAQQQAISSDPGLTNAVIEAWKARCAELGEDERKRFESYACRGLADYLEKLEEACRKHRNESHAFKFLDWFDPIFKAVELFMPAAIATIQAYPNPGSLILGGIIGAIQATGRFRDYQRLTVQLLARMGRKAHILQEFETVVYKSDIQVQMALVDVYGDIIQFCQRAVRFATGDGNFIARVKLNMFRSFEAQLGPLAQAFETHIEYLETLGWLCDKKRLKDLHDNLYARYTATERASADNGEHFQRLGAAMDQLLKRDREIQLQEEQRRKEKHKVALLDWLSSLSFRAAYDLRCDEHLDGTGFWLLDSETYKNWKSSDESDLLWVRGKPGSGKSVLAAVTITDLRLEVEPETALGYAFCRRGDESFQDPTKIFGALAKQVSEHKSAIDPVLEMECRASHSSTSPSQRAIRLVMASAVKQFRQIFLVVDALDECKDNDQLAQDLRDLVENKGLPPVKVIVFSRHEYNLEECFRPYKQIEPDLGANEEDLKAYIYSLFPDDSQKKSVNAEIRDECIAKADGMFLWVKLLAQNLRKPLRSKEKLKKIKEIPPGLDSIYDRILKDICNQDEDIRATAFLVLLWVIHAWRPLDRDEMLDAVADYSETTRLKDASKHDNAEHLVAMCANLVFIDKDGQFRLCHESVRGHLEKLTPDPTQPLSEFHQQMLNAHERLAKICLNYVLLDDFERGVALSLEGLVSFATRKPLLWYASNWHLHVTEENASLLRNLIMKCVNSQPRRELSMQFALLVTEYSTASTAKLWKYSGTSNQLHLLAICGLKQIAESTPDVISLALEADGSGRTPLTYAMEQQHHDMTLWLINRIQNTPGQSLDVMQKLSAIHSAAEHGWADILDKLLFQNEDLINLKIRPDGETPLTRACSSGMKEAAETLIRCKANVNLVDGKGDYPLVLAASYGHASVVDLLLAHGADPNCYDAQGFGPLHYASDIGNADIAAALLEKNADPLAAGPEGEKRSPLFVAASRNSVDVLKAFYEANSRLVVDLKAEKGMNPIHAAAACNSSRALGYLLEVGTQKDSLTGDDARETALNIAADMGSLESVKVLVKGGCDPSLPDAKGRNAIHAAARSGKLRIVRYILEKQPRCSWSSLVNRRGDNSETPLHSAVQGENPDIISFLLEAGGDPKIDGASASSPLHWAAEKGLTKIAAMLLQHTKEPNPRDKDDETPLHLAARAGKFDFIVQFFQDCVELGLSVDINARSKWNKTAFGLALSNDREDAAKFLLGKGSISVCDRDGNYPIHHAAWRGYDSIVEQLSGHEGADKRGYVGRTPLHCAALRGNLSTVKLLTKISANVLNEKDDYRNTPVSSALVNRHLEVAHYLLDMGVDYSGVDEYGNSLLRIAAGLPDLSMVQRLLSLGCRGDESNRFGVTPFSAAVEAGSTEIIDVLIAAGFDGTDLTDSNGNSCGVQAVGTGNLKMLYKLDGHEAQYRSRNLFGRTTAHAAAGGHPDILKFLNDRDVDLSLSDDEGLTPLMMAAQEGNAAGVSYLLQSQAHSVNQCTLFGRDTALTFAAELGYPQTIRLLLAAGADPHHRNVLGSSAIEYASSHRPSLREMHKAQYFHGSGSLETRKQTQINVIRQCCERILRVPQEPSVKQLYYRISRVCDLSSALLLVEDYETAKIPLIEIFWPPKLSPIEVTFECYICRSQKYLGDKYICQTCDDWKPLCKACHNDFEEAEGKLPDSLKEVLELEKQVLPVRLALLEETSLGLVYLAMRYFMTGCKWTETNLEKYEVWEQKYNSNNRFQRLPRPGQELLKLVMDVAQSIEGTQATAGDAAERAKAAILLNERYEKYRRQYGFVKDIQDFRCENHKFMVIKEEEARSAKAAGVSLGSEDERITTSFLHGLLDKYSDGSVRSRGLNSHISDPRPAALSRYAFADGAPNGYTAEGKTNEVESPRARVPQRSFTVAVREPVKRLRDFKSASMHTDLDFTPSAQPPQVGGNTHPARRARTLPVHLDAGFTAFFPNSAEILPQNSGSVLQKLDDLSSDHDIGALADHFLNPTSSSPIVELLSRSDGPQRSLPSSTRITTAPSDISISNRLNNSSKIWGIWFRLMVSGVGVEGPALDSGRNSCFDLALALHVTEAMTTGFIDTYFASQQDKRELAEVEDAPKSSSDSNDSDSDNDERTVADGGDEG
ncbi:hypothetical protein GP486_002074 [Trichoglossum hirsutum]|uniref:NACHT domain-containing protein n=1 Tax=Trichoglossum hirsutum TaxID=265104 RepID=A0A9P8LFW6_9PEZI|nr:hypothetical protein GP486_002074 [Trichoglossum hirsutum]